MIRLSPLAVGKLPNIAAPAVLFATVRGKATFPELPLPFLSSCSDRSRLLDDDAVVVGWNIIAAPLGTEYAGFGSGAVDPMVPVRGMGLFVGTCRSRDAARIVDCDALVVLGALIPVAEEDLSLLAWVTGIQGPSEAISIPFGTAVLVSIVVAALDFAIINSFGGGPEG